MKKSLISLYARDLYQLKQELQQYQNEALLWKTIEGTLNTGGNIALHIIGNLNTYFGKNLGNTGYIRDREAEFSAKDIPKNQLIKAIEEVEGMVGQVLSNLSLAQFEEVYPEDVLGFEMTTEYFMIHLLGHLRYHTGQINYHRRIVSV